MVGENDNIYDLLSTLAERTAASVLLSNISFTLDSVFIRCFYWEMINPSSPKREIVQLECLSPSF